MSVSDKFPQAYSQALAVRRMEDRVSTRSQPFSLAAAVADMHETLNRLRVYLRQRQTAQLRMIVRSQMRFCRPCGAAFRFTATLTPLSDELLKSYPRHRR